MITTFPNGALLVNKPVGITSFGVIDTLKKAIRDKHSLKFREMPKLGHGGTLDPFATGLLVVLCGDGTKFARYFLGAKKTYRGVIRFGETTIPGDPTDPISETSETVPTNLSEVQEMARKMTLQPYLQTPPMHSAKKIDGKPLYELARQGLEVEREPKLCHLYEFSVSELVMGSDGKSRARFQVECSTGTYIRTLAQDLARLLGSVGMLESLERTRSGIFDLENAASLDTLAQTVQDETPWNTLRCWVPMNRLLDGYPKLEISYSEARGLRNGSQKILLQILPRLQTLLDVTQVVLSEQQNPVATLVRPSLQSAWELERVIPEHK